MMKFRHLLHHRLDRPADAGDYLSFYDAAYPPENPPDTDGVCFYIGGNALNIWTVAQIDAQHARYRLPIFVRSDPPGPGAAADVATAVSVLRQIGAPEGCLVAWDMETATYPGYVSEVSALLGEAGYKLIVYGSQSSVLGNDNPNRMYFGADWTGTPFVASGDVMTQWISYSNYDLSEADPDLPLWDTQRPTPTPPEEEMPYSTMPEDQASWAVAWPEGSCTWASFYAGPPMVGKQPQPIEVTVHSQSKGNSQTASFTADGKKHVVTFTEKDVDAIGIQRSPDDDPETIWTAVAINAG